MSKCIDGAWCSREFQQSVIVIALGLGSQTEAAIGLGGGNSVLPS